MNHSFYKCKFSLNIFIFMNIRVWYVWKICNYANRTRLIKQLAHHIWKRLAQLIWTKFHPCKNVTVLMSVRLLRSFPQNFTTRLDTWHEKLPQKHSIIYTEKNMSPKWTSTSLKSTPLVFFFELDLIPFSTLTFSCE